jgi:Tfp pilus assembly protein PilF
MTQTFLLRYSFLLCLLGLSAPQLLASTAGESQSKFERTSQDAATQEVSFQKLLTASYREISASSPEFKLARDDFEFLIEAIKKADNNNDALRAIGLIVANNDLISRHSNNDALQILARILLKQQAIDLAEKIMSMVAQDGNTYLLGRIKFEFAKHYAETNNWNQVFAQLKEIDIVNTLEKEDGDEAFVIMGAALQYQKQHRQALNYYNRITPDSKHYRVAQLNTAIAYLRQDWWTDAHIAIKNALKKNTLATDELSNRLYTVMGFSQIQHGFYRDARESFRNVHIKSQYMNRALLGLGMAALHQEDFIGALNAFNHLKKGDTKDISVLESYLLVAFSLEKLGQQKTASASYTEAITFYEHQSVIYNTSIAELGQLRANRLAISRELAVQLNHDLRRIAPQLAELASKLDHLNSLLKYQTAAATQRAIKNLSDQMSQAYIDIAIEGLVTKQAIIDNYLSQSRFGLAKLYDTQ